MNDQDELTNKDIRPYGAIEEAQQAEQEFRASEAAEDASDEIAPPQQVADLPTPDHPTAHKLAAGFKKFDPVNYLRKYRAALGNYREGLHSQALERRKEAYRQQIEQEEDRVYGWRDRLAQAISWLAPIAGMMGPNGRRVLTLLGALGIVPLLIIALLLLTVCVCLGSWVTTNVIR